MNYFLVNKLHKKILEGNTQDVLNFLSESGITDSEINKRVLLWERNKEQNAYTALHLATQESTVDITKALIEHGADPTITDFESKTPLHWLCNTGTCTEILPLLVSAGSELNSKDKYGQTPLYMASWRSGLDSYIMQAMLLSLGANMNAEIKNKTANELIGVSAIDKVAGIRLLIGTYLVSNMCRELSDDDIYGEGTNEYQDMIIFKQDKRAVRWERLYQLYMSYIRKSIEEKRIEEG